MFSINHIYKFDFNEYFNSEGTSYLKIYKIYEDNTLIYSYDSNAPADYQVNNTGYSDNSIYDFCSWFFASYSNNAPILTKQFVDTYLKRLYDDNQLQQDVFAIFSGYPINLCKSLQRDSNPSYVYESRCTKYNFNLTFVDYDLYSEPIDNDNCFQTLNGISQVWSTSLSDDDYKKIMAIEAYNRNFLLSRIQSNELEIPPSSGSSDVDLSTINTQITNIANSLKVTETINNEEVEKNVTQVINDKDLLVVNNLDISDKLSFKPKSNGYPDDDLVI